MRIAVLSDPNNFHTEKWALSLERAGAEVTVFSFDAYKNGPLKAIQLKPTAALGSRYTYFSYLQGGKALRAALQAHKIDLVNPLNVTPFGVWAMQAGNRPAIISALGADILEYPPDMRQAPHLLDRSWANIEGRKTGLAAVKDKFSRNFYRKKVAQALEWADLVTGDNQHLVDTMQAWFSVPPEKLRVLRWGVEPALFEASSQELAQIRSKFHIPEGKKVVLSPRGAKAIYQADIILEAFTRLVPAHPEVHFIMLSAGYEVASGVQEAAERLQATHNNFVFMPGLVPREEVARLWNLVDIFVSAPVYDGYSAAVAEGRFAGAIPVVNRIPGNTEVITHLENGWICDPFTATQLAGDLEILLSKTLSFQQQFQPQNRGWVEKHSLVSENARLFMEWAETLLKNQR